MQSFALVGLLAALFSTAAAAHISSSATVGGHPTAIASSSAIFTFTTAPTVLPSTGVPYPVPTVGHGSGAPVYICYPIDAAAVPAPYPGNPSNATVPAGPATSSIGATAPAGPAISSIGATVPAGPAASSSAATISVA